MVKVVIFIITKKIMALQQFLVDFVSITVAMVTHIRLIFFRPPREDLDRRHWTWPGRNFVLDLNHFPLRNGVFDNLDVRHTTLNGHVLRITMRHFLVAHNNMRIDKLAKWPLLF